MSMLSIMMKEELLKGMSELIGDIVSKAVRHCGSKHNFDAEEMIRSLNIMDMSLSVSVSKNKVEKVSKKKVEKVLKSKFPMPFCGELKEGKCHALRQNHGLYTQCETDVKDEMYCKKCGPSAEFGTIESRLASGLMSFRDPKGKAPTAFSKVMKKLKISREEVEEEASKLNIVINDIHFEEEKVDKREKGRPKKPKKTIELADDSTDLFAVLVAKANEIDVVSDDESLDDDKVSIAESIMDAVLDKVNETVENNEKKAEKEALKLAEKQKKDAEKAEKEALKLAEKEALKLAEKHKKDAEKANKPVVKSKKETSNSETDKKNVKPAEKKVTKEVEEEEEDVVKRFEFEGVKYLKSKKTGIIYNMEQDVIGKWNEKTNKIDFEEAGSEEEEDEYDE